jgi:SEC-C motif/Family of unknown function (DUF5677)
VDSNDSFRELPAAADAARIEQRFAPQLDLCERLLVTVWSERPRPHPSMPKSTANCLAILGRSLEIYDSVLALVRTGRSGAALMLDRALFEDMIAAFWLSHPDNREGGVKRISDQEDHIVLLTNDVIEKYRDRVLIDPEVHEDLEARRNEFKELFGKHGDRAWFGDIYTAIGTIAPVWERLGGEERTLRVYYAIVHRHINQLVHNTVSSIKRSFERYDQPRKVDDFEIGIALRSAFFCLQGLAHLVFDETGTDRSKLSALEVESHTVFTDLDPKNLAKVGRNDPCPCGSGKKFKHCHSA